MKRIFFIFMLLTAIFAISAPQTAGAEGFPCAKTAPATSHLHVASAEGFSRAQAVSATSIPNMASTEGFPRAQAVSTTPIPNMAGAEGFPRAQAVSSTPHIVVGDNIWLLNGSGDKLFLLPKTYYAEISTLDETYYFVTFNGVAGKVVKTSVKSVGYHTQATGTAESLKMDAQYAEFTRLSVKAKPDRSSDTVTEMPTREAFTFVGVYPKEDEMWYAVRYNEFFGYIRADLTSKKTMTFVDFVPEVEPEGDNPATADPVPNEPPKNADGEGFSPLKIILIVGLALPAVFIIVLLFKKDSKKPKNFE